MTLSAEREATRVSVVLGPELYAQVARAARKQDRPMAALIRVAIRDYLRTQAGGR